MSKLLCIFAQLAEARAFLEHTKASPILDERNAFWPEAEGKGPSLYKFQEGWIAISGMGMHAAQMTVAKYAHLCDEVWNAGLAGVLADTSALGETLSITSIDKYIPQSTLSLDPQPQEYETFALPTLFLCQNQLKQMDSNYLNQGRLISSDFPIHDLSHREHLGKRWHLVDMEGYGIAYAALALGKKCVMWKIISDFASPGGRELIKRGKSALSERLAQKMLSNLPGGGIFF